MDNVMIAKEILHSMGNMRVEEANGYQIRHGEGV